MLTKLEFKLPEVPELKEPTENEKRLHKHALEVRTTVMEIFRTLNQPNVLAIDNVVIGAEDAAAGSFTTLTLPISNWTPALKFGGGSTGMTTSTATGSYMQIGGFYFACGIIQLTAKGSSTGDATLSLPATVRNDNDSYAPVSLRLSGVSFANVPQGRANINTATIVLQEITEAGAVTALTDADFTDTSQVVYELFFRAS